MPRRGFPTLGMARTCRRRARRSPRGAARAPRGPRTGGSAGPTPAAASTLSARSSTKSAAPAAGRALQAEPEDRGSGLASPTSQEITTASKRASSGWSARTRAITSGRCWRGTRCGRPRRTEPGRERPDLVVVDAPRGDVGGDQPRQIARGRGGGARRPPRAASRRRRAGRRRRRAGAASRRRGTRRGRRRGGAPRPSIHAGPAVAQHVAVVEDEAGGPGHALAMLRDPAAAPRLYDAAVRDAATQRAGGARRADARRDPGHPRRPGGHADLQPPRGAQRDDVGHVRSALRGLRGGGRRRLGARAGAARRRRQGVRRRDRHQPVQGLRAGRGRHRLRARRRPAHRAPRGACASR